MKRKIPTQLIIVASLAILAVSAWIYMYSCRDEVILNLQTISGDPACLSDKHFEIQSYAHSSVSTGQEVFDLDIGFPSGPVLEEITYGGEPLTELLYRFEVNNSYHNSGSPYELEIYTARDSWSSIVTGFQVKDESSSIPDEYYPEDTTYDSVRIDYSDRSPEYIEMDGIIYFTRPNYRYPLFHYELYESGYSAARLPYPVEYTAMSGIWALDNSSGASPENVVPYPISSDEASVKVFGVYAAEAENAVVLLTIDNGTDLFATVYDTKTKVTHEPVLIYHSDKGDIDLTICRENSSCPMGSIIVRFINDDSEWFALALGKNDITGNMEAAVYDIPQIKPFIDTYDSDTDRHLSYTDIYYRGEETWIIYDLTADSGSYITANLSVENYNIPYSSLLTQEIRIVAIKEGVIFYEGLLEFDLTAADIESELQYRINYDVYSLKRNNNKTQTEIY